MTHFLQIYLYSPPLPCSARLSGSGRQTRRCTSGGILTPRDETVTQPRREAYNRSGFEHHHIHVYSVTTGYRVASKRSRGKKSAIVSRLAIMWRLEGEMRVRMGSREVVTLQAETTTPRRRKVTNSYERQCTPAAELYPAGRKRRKAESNARSRALCWFDATAPSTMPIW